MGVLAARPSYRHHAAHASEVDVFRLLPILLLAGSVGCHPKEGEAVDTHTSGEQPGCAHRELPRGEGDPAVVGTTKFATNDDIAPCARSLGKDLRYLWRPEETDDYRISTEGSSFDTVLTVLDGCDGAVIACNDDARDLTSLVMVSAVARESYVIIVDGFERRESGHFRLSVTH